MNKIELLAPAGNLEKLKWALNYGADAVYIGGQDYSLRANTHNFTLEQIKEAVNYAHNLHKKVYVAVNIIFHDRDLVGVESYLAQLNEMGIDAIIVSDPAIIALWQKHKYHFGLHISTQASALNELTVAFYEQEGAERVVLAREASKEDILKIKGQTNIELECFIHGAMCTSFSGRCVLSNYLTNRDSNRGGCAQICRWSFTNQDQPDFSMTPKDLNMVAYIADMINIGIKSFKVEGRMRSNYYIATVIYYYRQIIDKIMVGQLSSGLTNYYLAILNRCANRDSAPQFYQALPTVKEQYFIGRDEVSNQDFLGIVLNYDQISGIVTLEQRNYFKKGTVVEFFGPNTACFSQEITDFYDEKDNELSIARHPQMIVKFKTLNPVIAGDIMRLKVFDISRYL
ncbi:MAG TPA: U32 family peptidase [Bacilli bacterium]|nr:U32 family peptidase [Bacilli bacterium]